MFWADLSDEEGLVTSPLRTVIDCAGSESPRVDAPGEDEVAHADVVDGGRRVVLEGDSWEFHAGKEAHARDCRRYTLLVVHGWTVLRFTCRQVMHDPDLVRWCLASLITGTPDEANVA